MSELNYADGQEALAAVILGALLALFEADEITDYGYDHLVELIEDEVGFVPDIDDPTYSDSVFTLQEDDADDWEDWGDDEDDDDWDDDE